MFVLFRMIPVLLIHLPNFEGKFLSSQDVYDSDRSSNAHPEMQMLTQPVSRSIWQWHYWGQGISWMWKKFGLNIPQDEIFPRLKRPSGQNVPRRKVPRRKCPLAKTSVKAKCPGKKEYCTLSPCHAMSNVPVYTHIQDPTRFYTRVFDAPFIAHKVTVKCVFMKTNVLDLIIVWLFARLKICAILQNNCQSAYKER